MHEVSFCKREGTHLVNPFLRPNRKSFVPDRFLESHHGRIIHETIFAAFHGFTVQIPGPSRDKKERRQCSGLAIQVLRAILVSRGLAHARVFGPHA
jgi:hypothetical protein